MLACITRFMERGGGGGKGEEEEQGNGGWGRGWGDRDEKVALTFGKGLQASVEGKKRPEDK